jgi:hypothetical protein
MNWRTWLRTCVKDKSSPINLPRARYPLAPLTGQDNRALDAIVACWQLYASSDDDGSKAALDAVRALLPAVQPECRKFARELIPFALDWPDRARLWPIVSQPLPAQTREPGRQLPPVGSYYCPICEKDLPLVTPCEHIDFTLPALRAMRKALAAAGLEGIAGAVLSNGTAVLINDPLDKRCHHGGSELTIDRATGDEQCENCFDDPDPEQKEDPK